MVRVNELFGNILNGEGTERRRKTPLPRVESFEAPFLRQQQKDQEDPAFVI